MKGKQLYKQYLVEVDAKRCLTCEFHIPTKGSDWGNCSHSESMAYYTQMDGYCPVIAKELELKKEPANA